MKIILLVEGARHTVDLTEEGTTIGRGAAADIRINSNAVSRVHAKFFLKDERVWVMDMKSLNGTSLNDVPVTEPAAMQPGDTALLGEVPVRWIEEEVLPTHLTTAAGAKITTDVRVGMEDRALDPSASIFVPHASIEDMLAKHQAESTPEVVDSLFQRLAAMVASLIQVFVAGI